MPQTEIPAAAFADTKPHYDILDGLRGVAALTVVCFHLFEAYATSHLDQRINHGYLAVDFFFILSGFVIGYAYDDRWRKDDGRRTSSSGRLIRLHPMVVIGALIGAVMFYFQGCSGLGCLESLRDHAAGGHADERAADSGDPRFRNPGAGRNVSAQRPELVAVLRIHRQHPLRASSSADFRPGRLPRWSCSPAAGWRRSPSGDRSATSASGSP